MVKWMGTLAVGIALGAAGVLLAQHALEGGLTPVLPPIGTPSPTQQPFEPPAPLQEPSNSPGAAVVSLAQIQGASYGFERTAALYDLLQSADTRRVEALLEEADAADLGWMVWPIYSRYVDLAPQAALNYLVSQEPVQTSQVYGALFAWALEDLDAALAFAETLDQPLRTQAGRNLLYTLIDLSEDRQDEIAKRLSVGTELTQMRTIAGIGSDPANAWQKAQAMEKGELRTRTLWTVARRWFDQDPAAALTALESVGDDKQRSQWQRQLLLQWVGTDRQAALRWSASLPPSEQRASLLGEVAATAAKDSPVEVLEFAETLDPKDRREIARQVLTVWAESNPRVALAALEQMDDRRLTQMAQSMLVGRWSQSDPLAVFEWARTRPASDSRMQALTTALRSVAESAPTDALALAGELDARARSNAIESILGQWGRDDSRAAAAWLDNSPHKTPAAVAAVVNGYAAFDAEEAFDWLRTQSDEAQRRSTSAIVWYVAEESPEAALEMISRIDDPATTASSGSQLMSRWARDDPHAAVRAIARLDDDARLPLYRSAFSAWARYDLEGATAFVDQVPASYRDGAIGGVLQYTLSEGSVQEAEELFDRIVDEEIRSAAATTMYLRLSQTDPKRAERYREMSEMTIAADGSITVTIPAESF